jgi:hypothetical protein
MSSPIARGLTCSPLLTGRASTGHLARRRVADTTNVRAGQAASTGSIGAPAALPTGTSGNPHRSADMAHLRLMV